MKKYLRQYATPRGQMLVELVMAIGIAAIILPALLTGLVTSREGRPQQQQRAQATASLKEIVNAVRSVRDDDWTAFSTNGTFHPVITNNKWTFASNAASSSGFTKQVVVSDVYRDIGGAITTSGGTLDPSTKKADVSISWTQPQLATISATIYLTRTTNLAYTDTTAAQFNAGTITNLQVTNTAGGEMKLGNNNKAKWCTPAFSSATIDLPDGPPVAVAATASASITNPNDVFVAVASTSAQSTKLAYVNVSANTAPPTTVLKGTFTLDASKYSAGTYPSSLGGLTNTFRTNDVKYYKSPAGKKYALLATDLSDHEVVAVQINDGSGDAYQDPVNHIYKYWTYFNTRMYNPNAGLTTGFTNPSANAADSGGDGDGYGTNPTRAYSDNASFATDSNSGNNTGTNCTGADKDKHRYYNYGFSLPSGANINGIEVRLDSKVDSIVGSPKQCVQLSWDGGTSWTTAKSTSTLTTGEVSYTLGGSADTWGRTWTNTNFSNANLRVRVIDVASDTSRDFSLDWAAVNVYYSSGTSGNDQSPHDYGAKSITVLNDTGYVASGGYMYTFDLSNIDSKTPTAELDQIGCRIELEGYDCKPGSPAIDKKYDPGETGTTWSDTGSPAHNDCSDGGNIELYADNHLSGVQSGGHNYIYVAVGAGTNSELNIVDATSVPTSGTSPAINNSTCGRTSGGNSGWKVVGALDFNSNSNTEEASNSVYASNDGTRAYISSNGTSDSKQFYVINTSNKTSPSFLTGTPATGPGSGFYQSSGANGELYPRRSLTVLNGQRAVLVGKDGVTNGNDAQEYQVLDMYDTPNSESNPGYCGGLNYDIGFNDLTSVSEADGDNFVYMVANTTANELKIIEGGPDNAIYVPSGTFESTPIDASNTAAFNRFVSDIYQPANTTVGIQVASALAGTNGCSNATYTYRGPGGTSDSNDIYTATGSGTTTISNLIPLLSSGSYQNPGRCLKYKAYLGTNDPTTSPIFNDMIVNYSL